MPRPIVSVLIDTYNHERFIEEAVNSVLAQDFPASEREIVVVDDGSTDRTPDILRTFVSEIRVLTKANGGQASAFNCGIPECRGELIAFLETQLVETTLEQRFTKAKPARMIGDRAYDSDPLDRRLREKHGIHLISPHHSNRSRKATQDGRELRRYCRRWKIERLFAWLHNFRRLVTRWEHHEVNFLAMLQLGCLIILLRNL